MCSNVSKSVSRTTCRNGGGSVWNVRNINAFARGLAIAESNRLDLTCGEFLDRAVGHLRNAGPAPLPLFAGGSIHSDLLSIANMAVRDVRTATKCMNAPATSVAIIGAVDNGFSSSMQRCLTGAQPRFFSSVQAALSEVDFETPQSAERSANRFDIVFFAHPLGCTLRQRIARFFFEQAADLLNAGGRLVAPLWRAVDPPAPGRCFDGLLETLKRDNAAMQEGAVEAGIPATVEWPAGVFSERRAAIASIGQVIEMIHAAHPASRATDLSLLTLAEQFLINAGMVAPRYAIFAKPGKRKATDYFAGGIPLRRAEALFVSGIVDDWRGAGQLLGAAGDRADFRREPEAYYRGPIVLAADFCPWQGWAGHAVEAAVRRYEVPLDGKYCLVAGSQDQTAATVDFLQSRNVASIYRFEFGGNFRKAEASRRLDDRIVELGGDFVDNIGYSVTRKIYDLIVVDTEVELVLHMLGKILRIAKPGSTIMFFVRNRRSEAGRHPRFRTRPDSSARPLKPLLAGIRQWIASVDECELLELARIRSDSGKPEYLGVARR